MSDVNCPSELFLEAGIRAHIDELLALYALSSPEVLDGDEDQKRRAHDRLKQASEERQTSDLFFDGPTQATIHAEAIRGFQPLALLAEQVYAIGGTDD